MGEPRRQDAILLRRSYYTRNVGIVVGVLAGIVSFLNLGDRRVPLVLALGTVAATLVLLGAKGFLRRVPASAEAIGIRVGGRVVARKGPIESAWVETACETVVVHLDGGFRSSVELETNNEGEAAAVLAALFGDSGPPLSDFVSTSRWLPAAVGVVLGQLIARALIGHAAAHERLGILVLSLLLVALLFYGRARVTVGADGILLSGAFRRRFIPFNEVESATAEDDGGQSSCTVVIRTRKHGSIARRMKAGAAQAAVGRIERSLAVRDENPAPHRLSLRREGADARTWLSRLRSLARSEPYRAVSAPGESLWRLIDDPGAAETERAAAAVVIGAAANGEERRRLRQVAARVASPRVRVAIECAASGAVDDELVAAIAPIEDSA
jgi:hypothetical protein